jgi:hypothetical protein
MGIGSPIPPDLVADDLGKYAEGHSTANGAAHDTPNENPHTFLIGQLAKRRFLLSLGSLVSADLLLRARSRTGDTHQCG